MNDKYFIDSNVFIYVFDETDSEKRTRSVDWIQSALREGIGYISYQVVQETINVITRKLGATVTQTHQFVEDVLVPLWSVNPTDRLYRFGLEIMRRYGCLLSKSTRGKNHHHCSNSTSRSVVRLF